MTGLPLCCRFDTM